MMFLIIVNKPECVADTISEVQEVILVGCDQISCVEISVTFLKDVFNNLLIRQVSVSFVSIKLKISLNLGDHQPGLAYKVKSSLSIFQHFGFGANYKGDKMTLNTNKKYLSHTRS